MATRKNKGAVAFAFVTGTLGLIVPRLAPAEAAATNTVAFYSMDEAGGTSVLVDSGTNRIHGTIGADVGSSVGYSGARAHRFEEVDPTALPANPEHLDSVPHNAILNPGTEDFAVTVRYRTTKSYGNVVQKGQNKSVGGYFKFEAPSGKMTCLFKGSKAEQRAVISPMALNDGEWHTVRCERLSTGVRMFVDGVFAVGLNGPTGSIANDKNLSIGGKTSCDQIVVTCDYFSGDIDYVRIEKGASVRANLLPIAAIEPVCTGMICTFSGQTSSDDDGAIQTYAWDFGDGGIVPASGLADNTTHVFTTPGRYTVRVTVVDDQGAAATTATEVDVAPVPELISFVGQQTANSNATTHTVTVPSTVRPGDGMLLFFSENTHSAITDPQGWLPMSTIDGGFATTRAWRKVATIEDRGHEVSVGLAAQAKGTLTLLIYRGTSLVDPVSSFRVGTDAITTAARTTPFAPVTVSRGWALSYWMHGDSDSSALTAPAGVVVRAEGTQTGGGRVTTLIGDSNASVPLGTSGGLTATALVPSYTMTAYTVILEPTLTPPPNIDPQADGSASCELLTCIATAAKSFDLDGSIVSYLWDFGDGTQSTDASAVHTYAESDDYTITLTVTDDRGAQSTISIDVEVSDFVPPPPVDVITFVGSASSNVNATTIGATVPTAVAPGDGLLLFVSQNTNASLTGPTGMTGWVLLETVIAGTTSTRVWQKVAATGDAGTVVSVQFSAKSKANMMIAAYHGTSSTGPVAAFTAIGAEVNTNKRITPTITADAPSWVVSYWMHRDSTTNQLTMPLGPTMRARGTQTTSGRVTCLLADSGAMVANGPYGGLIAEAAAASSSGTAWTIVLAPGSQPVPR